jgi:hypothetical protein
MQLSSRPEKSANFAELLRAGGKFYYVWGTCTEWQKFMTTIDPLKTVLLDFNCVGFCFAPGI